MYADEYEKRGVRRFAVDRTRSHYDEAWARYADAGGGLEAGDAQLYVDTSSGRRSR